MSSVVAVWAIAAYLIGAIPVGYLIGRSRGIDIRKAGSGNIGATNVGRVLGKPLGHLCLILDIAKGLIPVLAARWTLVSKDETAMELLAWLIVAVSAVIGHVFPVYLGFRGGKGVATTIGVALAIYPYFTFPMIASLVAYTALRMLTGIVSVGSLAIAILFPISFFALAMGMGWSSTRIWPMQAAAVVLSLVIIVRHISNIRRLLQGTEFAAPK
jgi:glycerol-3-phosphate acyltransferase PlsY